jgi:glutamate-ammonia-ligase adenylyltransferase
MQFLDLMQNSPLVFDEKQAFQALEAVIRSDSSAIADFASKPEGKAFLLGVFGGSPFLTRASEIMPKTLEQILVEGPDASLKHSLSLFADTINVEDRNLFMSALRKARLATALTVGLADLGGVWKTLIATRALSAAADAAISAAVNWLFRDGVRRGVFKNADASGFIVLGMGKLGAWELNYCFTILKLSQ